MSAVSRHLRQRHRLREIGMRRGLPSYDRSDERGVARARCPGVEEPREARVGSLARQVVIVAGVMITRAAPKMSERPHDRQMVRLLRQPWQMLAELDVRSRRGDRPERTTVLDRCVGLHVPRVDVGSAATQKDEDRGLRATAGTLRREHRTACRAGQAGAAESEPTRDEKRPPIDGFAD